MPTCMTASHRVPNCGQRRPTKQHYPPRRGWEAELSISVQRCDQGAAYTGRPFSIDSPPHRALSSAACRTTPAVAPLPYAPRYGHWRTVPIMLPVVWSVSGSVLVTAGRVAIAAGGRTTARTMRHLMLRGSTAR